MHRVLRPPPYANKYFFFQSKLLIIRQVFAEKNLYTEKNYKTPYFFDNSAPNQDYVRKEVPRRYVADNYISCCLQYITQSHQNVHAVLKCGKKYEQHFALLKHEIRNAII